MRTCQSNVGSSASIVDVSHRCLIRSNSPRDYADWRFCLSSIHLYGWMEVGEVGECEILIRLARVGSRLRRGVVGGSLLMVRGWWGCVGAW